MKKIKNPMKATFVRRKPPLALKVLLALLILVSALAVTALSWVHGAIQQETEQLRDQAAAVEYANSQLEERIQEPDTFENMLKAALEELGLMDPDTVVIDPE